MEPSRQELLVENEELKRRLEELQDQVKELQAANREIFTAHNAIRKNRDDLNRAQAVTHTGSWRLDVRQNKLIWSEENHRIFGIPPETPMSYETFLASVYPEDREYVDRKWTAALAGEPYDIEHRIVVGDTVRWVREQAVLEFDAYGRLLGGFGTTQDITERKLAEEALRESEARLRLATQVGRMFAFEWDLRTDAVVRSAEAGLILGLSGDAAVFDTGQGFFAKILEEDRDNFVHLLQNLAPESGRYTANYRVARPDNGQVIWLEEIAQAFFDAPGKLQRIYGVCMDVTERRQAEAALRAVHIQAINEKNRLEAVMEALPVAVAILDERGGTMQFNDRFDKLWGSPRPQPHDIEDYQAYKAWWLDTGKEVQPEEWASAQAVQQGKTVLNQLLEIETFEGLRCCVINSGAPIRDADGKITGSAVAIIDITEQRQAEAALRKSEERLRLAQRAAQVGMWEWHPQSGTLDCTPELELLYGLQPGTLRIYQDWRKLVHTEDLPYIEADLNEAFSRQIPFDLEFRIKHASGETRWLQVKGGAFYSKDGRPERVRGISLDITERKHMEEALRLSHQRLDLLAESASRLLASEAPQEVVDIICPKIMEFLDCDVFFNFLLDEQERRLHLNAWAGIPEQEARQIEWLDYGAAVCGRAARDGCRIVAEDIQTTSDGQTELVKSYGIQAYACHPLMVQGRILGTLSFGTRTRNRFSKDELALMQAVADQVAVAMDRKLFLEALRQARDELEKRVRERTKDLQTTVTQLQEEVLERLRTEAELSQQSKLVHDLYNQAPCGYHSLDAEGKFVQINETELAWLGYTREELIGKIKFSDLLTSQGQKFFQQSFLNFKERGWVKDLEYDLIRKDGTAFPVLLSATAIKDEAGNYLMSRGTVYDLTDRIQAEAALAKERQRLFQVLEQLPAYVVLLAPDYTVPYANREFNKRFGVAKKGQRCYEFLFRRDKPCEHCLTFRVLKDNFKQEWEWQGPDGRTYAVFDYPFTDVDGSPLILELGLDITERKRAEQALRESEERLRFLANELLTTQEQERKRLASELHDELGHALLTMKLSLGAITRNLLPEQDNVKKLLQEQLEYINHVIEGVRRLYYDLSPGDLEDLGLTKALENLIEDFGSHQSDIVWEVDLPDLKGRLALPTQTIVYRLVQEALTNIGKHAKATQVSISAQEENGHLRLVIEDDGRGFDLSEIDRDPNRGLGLAAMRERLYIIGGSTDIWSQKAQGTRLTFTIPTLPKDA